MIHRPKFLTLRAIVFGFGLLVATVCFAPSTHAASPVVPLVDAAARGDAAEVTRLIASKIDVNLSIDTGTTALMAAAARGDKAMVAQLIAAGANVNQRGKLGGTALHAAASSGNGAVIQLLIAAKADIKATDLSGATPLELTNSGRKWQWRDGCSPHRRQGQCQCR